MHSPVFCILTLVILSPSCPTNDACTSPSHWPIVFCLLFTSLVLSVFISVCVYPAWFSVYPYSHIFVFSFKCRVEETEERDTLSALHPPCPLPPCPLSSACPPFLPLYTGWVPYPCLVHFHGDGFIGALLLPNQSINRITFERGGFEKHTFLSKMDFK